jgi:hypothetical protein
LAVIAEERRNGDVSYVWWENLCGEGPATGIARREWREK